MAAVLLLRVALVGTVMLLPFGLALTQQTPPGYAWNKYLYAQDATQQGKIDISLLDQISAMASTQGFAYQ